MLKVRRKSSKNYFTNNFKDKRSCGIRHPSPGSAPKLVRKEIDLELSF